MVLEGLVSCVWVEGLKRLCFWKAKGESMGRKGEGRFGRPGGVNGIGACAVRGGFCPLTLVKFVGLGFNSKLCTCSRKKKLQDC